MMNNNIFNNQQYNGYGYGGMVYNQQQPPKMTTGLSPELQNELRNMRNTFTLQVTPEEQNMSKCYHKHNGQFATHQNPDGSYTCDICHATFNVVETTPEEVREISNQFINILQTIKLFNVDMPDQWASFFSIIPMINKVPELYKISLDTIRKYQNGISNINQQNGLYGYNALAMLTNPAMGYGMGMPMGGYYNQPMNNNGYGPMVMNNQMGYYNQPMPMNNQMNQLPYNQNQMNNGYAPMNQGYYNPSMPMNNQGVYQNGSNGFGINAGAAQQPAVNNSGVSTNPTKMTTPVQPGEVKTTVQMEV